MKKLILFGMVWLVLGSALCMASTKNTQLQLSADEIVNDDTEKEFSASGNVEALYRNLTLNTQVIRYTYGLKLLQLPQFFRVTSSSNFFEANELIYDMGTYTGKADRIRAHISKAYITGSTISFTPAFLEVKEATFTTCELPTPHFQVHSGKMLLYPQVGVIVAFDNDVEIQGLPFRIWLPTYIYGNSAYSIFGRSAFPEFGSNPREGAYVKESIPYFVNPYSHGTWDIGLMQKAGLWIGVNHRQQLAENHMLNTYIHSLGSEGMDLGLIYSWRLLHASPDKEATVDWLPIESTSQSLVNTKFILTFGELINYSRVDRKPQVRVELQKYRLWDSDYQVESSLQSGMVGEKDSTDTYREFWQTQGDVRLFQTYTVEDNWRLTPEVRYLGNWYSVGEWNRVMATFAVTGLKLWGKPTFSFSKKVLARGSSPFEFERLYAFEHDELGLAFENHWDQLGTRANLHYDLETAAFRAADLSLIWSIHCWQTIFTWNTLTGNINFGVSLN